MATGSVMVCAEPTDPGAEYLAAVLEQELGEDGRIEENLTRDIWYSNIVQFAAKIDARQATELLAWVSARRSLSLGEMLCEHIQLVQWAFHNGRLIPRVLLDLPLARNQ